MDSLRVRGVQTAGGGAAIGVVVGRRVWEARRLVLPNFGVTWYVRPHHRSVSTPCGQCEDRWAVL